MAHVSNKGVFIFTTILLSTIFFSVLFFMIRDYIVFNSAFLLSKEKITEAQPLAPRNRSISFYKDIIAKNPFGITPSSYLPPEKRDDQDVSNVKAKLLGTVSGDSGTGYAILLNQEGKQELFKVGENVFNLGVLVKVTHDAVFIKGSRETKIPILNIDKRLPTFYKNRKMSNNRNSSAFIRKTSENSFVVDQRKVLSALENPRQLMTDARLQPRFIKGKQDGFVLGEVKKGGIYDQLRLQNGDILLSINRYDITNPEVALQAFSALRGASDIELNIIRRSRKMTLSYQIR